jgi:hypothetical protein
MTKPKSAATALAVIAFAAAGVLPAFAQLPSLDKQPWFGYFAAFSNAKFRFGVTSHGKIILTPMLGRDKPVGHKMELSIDIAIEELTPGGKTITRKIKPETLASAQPATDKLQKTTITGKVTGDASFEVTIEQQRDVISIGGRLLDPGTLKKNPLRFAIHCEFPDAYYSAKTNARKDAAKAAKAFEKTIDDDRIQLMLTDKKRKKLKLDEKIGPINPEINGPGIAEAEVEISSYKGRKFVLTSAPETPIKLWNAHARPLHQGFSFVWTPDPVKDKEGKARMSIEVK